MKLFILFSIFIATSAMIRPPTRAPKPGDPIRQNPNDYKEQVWNYFSNINNVSDSENYLIPNEVIKVIKYQLIGTVTEIHLHSRESTCPKTLNMGKFNEKDCKVLIGGDKTTWTIREADLFDPYNQSAEMLHFISTTFDGGVGTRDDE